MNKAKVKSLTISDRIYIRKSDIENYDYLVSLFTYFNGEEHISTLVEYDDYITLPSNSYNKLEWDSLEDIRNFEELAYQLPFSGTLRSEQQEVVDAFTSRGRARSGVIQAPCGFGKTFTSCAIIAKNNTKTLILVHTKLLYKQWIEELERLLPGIKIGRIGDGDFDLQDVTVAIYKTVYNNLDKLCDHASLVLIDEAHMCPADMFSTTLNNLNAKIKMGVTATPRRKDGKHVFFADYFTDYLISAKDTRKLAVPKVQIIKTDVKFNVIEPKRDWVKQTNKLAENENYLDFIAEIAIKHIKQGRCPLILSERVGMLESLQKKIPNSICLLGKTKEEVRKDALENAGGKYKALLSTKLFDEGISCHRLDTLILTCPSSNTIKLEQRIGRIEREHPDAKHPLVIDIWLSGAIVSRQQQNRLAWYKQREYNIL